MGIVKKTFYIGRKVFIVSILWFLVVGVLLASDTAFYQDFEGAVALDEDSSSHFLWEVGIPTYGPALAHEGTRCLGTVLDGVYGADYVSDFVVFGPIYIPIDWPRATLSFYHFYDFEPGYDGGNIMLSTDGQNYSVIGIDVYSSSSVAGLNRGDSPVTYSQPGFTGQSNGWEKVLLDLSAYRGDTVYLKFHFGTDNSVNNYAGWYIDEILIDTQYLQGPVIYVTHDITDTGPNGRDYAITAGDTINMLVALQNKGNYTIDTVYCRVIPLDTYVETVRDTLVFHNLTKNAIKYSAYDLTYKVSLDIPHNEVVDFRVEITDDSGDLWVYYFSEIALNPGIVGPLFITSYDIYDFNLLDLYGNENGVLNRNERVAIPVTVYNAGKQTAGFVYSVLSTDDTHIVLVDTTAYFGDIYGESYAVSKEDFVIQTSNDITEEDTVLFYVTHYSGDLSWEDSFTVRVYSDTYTPAAIQGQVFKNDGVTPETEAYIYVYNMGYETSAPIFITQPTDTGFYKIDTMPTGDFTLMVKKPDTPYLYTVGIKSVYGIVSGHRTVLEDIIEWPLKNELKVDVFEKGNGADVPLFPYDVYIKTPQDTYLMSYSGADSFSLYFKYIAFDTIVLGIVPSIHNAVETTVYFDTTAKKLSINFDRYLTIQSVSITDTRVSQGYLLPWTLNMVVSNSGLKDVEIESYALRFYINDTPFLASMDINPKLDYIAAGSTETYTITVNSPPPDSGALSCYVEIWGRGIVQTREKSRDTYTAELYNIPARDFYNLSGQFTDFNPQFTYVPPAYPTAWNIYLTIENSGNEPLFVDSCAINILKDGSIDTGFVAEVNLDTDYVQPGKSLVINAIVKSVPSDTGFYRFDAWALIRGEYLGDTGVVHLDAALADTLSVFGQSQLTLVSNEVNKRKIYLQQGGVIWYTMQFINPRNTADSIDLRQGNTIYLVQRRDGKAVDSSAYRVIKPFADTQVITIAPQSYFYIVYYVALPAGQYIEDFTVYAKVGRFRTEEDFIADPAVKVLLDPTVPFVSSFFDSYLVVGFPTQPDTSVEYKLRITRLDYEDKYKRADRYLSGQRRTLFRDGLIEITLYNAGAPVDSSNDVTLEFHYNRLANYQLCDEEYLTLLRFDDRRGRWEKVTGFSVYPTDDVIVYKGKKLGVFRVADLSPQNSFDEIKVYPNPFKTFEDEQLVIDYIPDDRDLKIEIYDVAGDLVKVLDYASYSSGKVLWDGRDMWGNRVGTGFYFLKVKVLGEERIFYLLVIN